MRTIALVAAALTLAACGNATMSSTGTSRSGTPLPTASTSVTAGVPTPSARCGGPTPTKGGWAIVDWVDFVKVGDVTFTAATEKLTHPSGTSDVGAVVGTVECRLSDVETYRGGVPTTRSGDAAFLAPGTSLRAADGFAPTCRLLAVNASGGVSVYLADDPDATVHTTTPCALNPTADVN